MEVREKSLGAYELENLAVLPLSAIAPDRLSYD